MRLIDANEAAKIVICKECKFHENSDVKNRIWCRNMCRYMKEDGFCSEGGKDNERETD